MNSYETWEYLGTQRAPIGYSGSEYIHGFYNPEYNKMWCFYTDDLYPDFYAGQMVDLTVTEVYDSSYIERVIKETSGFFIGARNDFFRDMLPKLREKYKNTPGPIFPTLKENTKESWMF